jgi:hypothetical protein
MEPYSPIAGIWMAITRDPFELQVTPTQELQIGAPEFQLSFRAGGTAAAKSRRACLSDFKSAIIITGKIASMKRKSICMAMKEGGFMDIFFFPFENEEIMLSLDLSN